MLGKLIKYDMKSMSRVLIPLWIAAPVISFLFSLSIKGLVGVTEYTVNHTLESQALIQGSAVVTGIVTLIFFGVMVAILVMTVLFVVQRFWNGLLKEEGYLMFTLPVETWELVLSKGICATAVGCVSSVVAVLSCVVMALGTFGDYTLLWESLGDFVGYMVREQGIFWWSCDVALFVLLSLVGIAESVYRVYAAMAMGQLFERHRVLGSCLAYIGIGVAWSMVSGIFLVSVSLAAPDWAEFFIGTNAGIFGTLYFFVMLLITVLQIVLWHLITVNILSKHLNLE